MKPLRPLRGRAIIVAPHPDDEAIGACALIRALRRHGVRVDVVIASDGGASHPESRAWPRERLVRERRREVRRAMRSLGLAPPTLRFLDLPDGALPGRMPELVRALGRVVDRGVRPTLIVGPVPHDAHADHRAVAAALKALPRRGALRLGYRVWSDKPPRRPAHVTVRLDTAARAAKRRLVRSYRTQTGTITDAVAGFAMTQRHVNAFVRPRELFEVLR